MMGGAKGRWATRKREKLKMANGPTPKIIPQSDEKPMVYLSHTVVHYRELEEEFLKCSGVRYRCFSFVYVDPKMIYWSPRAKEAYDVNVEHKNHIFMDSGAFSFQMFLRKKEGVADIEKLRQDTLDQFERFCKKRQKEWDWFATFDYEPKALTVWKMTKELERRNLHPVPVYHGDSSIDWVKKYMDAGYKKIGVSPGVGRRLTYKNARKVLDEVFRAIEPYKVWIHGFGMTAPSMVFSYPWTSVDSSSWSRVASLGGIYVLEPGRASMATVHLSTTGGLKKATSDMSVSTLSPGALKSLRDHVEKKGWDFELLRRSLSYRFIYNAHVFAHLHEHKKSLQDSYLKWQTVI
jgi:hypothetical protein